MATCRSCATDNPDRAKFCLECGSPFAPPVDVPHESRRTVTVLFSDLVGSTALGEQLDAEAVWEVMSSYFSTMQAAIERHGGVVEKFIGDAIMAVFGLSQVHEDDALRAVRAALDMRAALAELNAELQEVRGVSIATRTGINTGEVLASDPSRRQTLVTGDAVNTAARLEQAAGPGVILLGRSTARLVAGHVETETVEPVPAKGKAEPIPAARLIALRLGEGAATRGPAAPMIGRESELESLRAALRMTVAGRSARVVTVLGSAGVGKSRLVAEFLEGLGADAAVLRGRCLSYGAGITYWPLREILHAAAGITDGDSAAEGIARLELLLEGEAEAAVIAARLASAIGLTGEPATAEEIFWAARRTFERLSVARPLVAVIEDIHWAEPTLLDLIRDIAEHATGAALLLVCPARPELTEQHPDWDADQPNMQRIELDTLTDEGMARLFDALSTEMEIDPGLRGRILTTAEGNPLFVEEMLRMLGESDGQQGKATVVPPNIQALMAARVDGLPPLERSVGQRAAVVGREFEEQAVVAMTPDSDRPEVAPGLQALVRRNLLSSRGPDLTDSAAFKFRHILLRDAAYGALTKSERADLHERFADWLEESTGERIGEYQEIVGYHFEQAYRYRSELRQGGARTQRLGNRAVDHLEPAARRSRQRGDVTAAVGLYRRADVLPRPGASAAARFALAFGAALLDVGESAEGLEQADRAFELAEGTADLGLRARARMMRMDARQIAGDLLSSDAELRAEVALALADAEASDDPLALAEAWRSRSMNSYSDGDLATASAEQEKGIQHAHRLDDAHYELELEIDRLTMTVVGPEPNGEVLKRAQAAVARATGFLAKRGDLLRLLALAEGMDGQATSAQAHILEALASSRELNLSLSLIFAWFDKSWVDRMCGDYLAAEIDLKEAIREADRVGDRSMRAMSASRLSVALIAQGRYDEAEPWVDEAALLPIVTNKTRVVGARARIAAHRGDGDAASSAAHEVVGMVAHTAFVHVKADALIDAGEAMATLGETGQAVAWLNEALAVAETKEHRALAEQLRARLAELTSAAPATSAKGATSAKAAFSQEGA
jgi:class 3 adenylate cyclase/tetratricopeptide (TPR) repeat protein